ncbi:MAG TPA: outer membrane protein assembly factor BamD [Pyrinomonadaceae bacterium]|nr:outer membrane protein assembly factor BamD [Pyrinomonadaceae bacterium]
MFYSRTVRCLSLFVALLTLSGLAVAQDGSDAQRISIMSDKLNAIRRSLGSSESALKAEAKAAKEKVEETADSPISRVRSLDKEASRLQSDISNIRGKIDRGEKYERKDLDSLEQSVSDLQSRVDKFQTETATARANASESREGQTREIKKKKKFLWIFGGKGNDEFDELLGTVTPGRDKELFVVATREVRKKNYDVGRLLFQTIITTYPDSPYLPMAKLAVADSFFIEGTTSNLIQAIAAYQDWLTFFPTHPLADRVVLKIAESEMRQIGLPDRDVTRAKRAEVRLKNLLAQYPNSILKDAAKLRLSEVQDNIGLHNLLIANYYYTLSVDQKKGGLKGAQSRLNEILDKYPDFKFMDEVLFKAAVTYQIEEETDQAVRYFQRLVSDYPNSKYLDKAKEQLTLMGASIPPTNPERANVLPPEDESFFSNFKNQFFGVYPLTIDRDGVLMSRDFDKEAFELIDQTIENQGDILLNQIPPAFTTVVKKKPAVQSKVETPAQPPVK